MFVMEKLPVMFVLPMVKEVSSGKASTLPQLAGSTPACILHSISTLYVCTNGVTTCCLLHVRYMTAVHDWDQRSVQSPQVAVEHDCNAFKHH